MPEAATIEMPPMSRAVRRVVEDRFPMVIARTPDLKDCPTGVFHVLTADAFAAFANSNGSFHHALVVCDTPSFECRKWERWAKAVGLAPLDVRVGSISFLDATVDFRDPAKAHTLNTVGLDRLIVSDLSKIDQTRWAQLLERTTTDRTRITAVCPPVPLDHWSRQIERRSEHALTFADGVAARLIDKRTVEAARSTLPPHEFEQRYMGVFADTVLSVPGAGQSMRKFAALRLKVRTNDVPPKIVPFNMRPIQQRYLAMKRLGRMHGYRMFILLKYRRGGFTTLEQGLSYRHAVTHREARCITLAHTAPDTQVIFQIAKRYHEHDPHAPASPGQGSATRLYFPQTNSLFHIATAGAQAPGRGDTLDRVHASEVSKWCPGPRQNASIDDLMSGLTQAASNGEVVLESTPWGVNWFCNTYRDAKHKRNAYFPIFLRWYDDPTNIAAPGTFDPAAIMETLTDEEKALMRRWRMDPDTAGLVDLRFVNIGLGRIAWRRKKKLETGRLFVQEYPEDDETCFLTSGTCYFDVAAVQDMMALLPDYTEQNLIVPGVSHKEVRFGLEHGWLTKWEAAPDHGERYVIGVDTSEGREGSDPCGYGVIKVSNGAQVESLHGRFTPNKLAELSVAAAKRWSNAWLGIEREGPGLAVIERAKQLGYRSPNLLYQCRPGVEGWSTNAITRPVMLNDLSEIVRMRHDGIRDREFLGECLSFNLQTDGSYSADGGAHDDRVMKWAIAEQVRKARRPARGPITL